MTKGASRRPPSGTTTPREGAADPARTLVYADIDSGDDVSLVFIPRTRAEELAAIHGAIRTSRTWGEFRSRIPRDDFDYALTYLDGNLTFEEFVEEQRAELPEGETPLPEDELCRRYREMPIDCRLPVDEDPFDVTVIGWISDGDWPGWPAQQMLDWVPKDILETYGITKESVLNGPFVEFDWQRKDEIVSAFERNGYYCIHDQALVECASGQ